MFYSETKVLGIVKETPVILYPNSPVFKIFAIVALHFLLPLPLRLHTHTHISDTFFKVGYIPPLPQNFSVPFLRTEIIILYNHNTGIRFKKFNIERIIFSLCSLYSSCVKSSHSSAGFCPGSCICHDSLVSFNEEFLNFSLPLITLAFLKIISQLFYFCT